MSPTDPHSPLWRYLITGLYEEDHHYAFRREQGCHDHLLILTLSGRGVIEHEAGTFGVRRGDCVLLKPNQMHAYRTDPDLKRWTLLWAHFIASPSWQDLLQWPVEGPGVGLIRVEDAQAWRCIRQRMLETHQLATSMSRYRERLALNALESVLLRCSDHTITVHDIQRDRRINQTVEYIQAHLGADLSNATLSDHAGLSPSRFAHLFREQMSVTPQQFVEKTRIDRAKHLLEHTNHSVKRIANMVGFASPFYLSRRFRQATLISPRDYRQRLGPK